MKVYCCPVPQILSRVTTLLLYSTEIADNHGDAGDCHDAVIAVPLHFNEKQRHAVRTCAEKGGFNVLRVIDETSAVVLAYDVGQINHHEDW